MYDDVWRDRSFWKSYIKLEKDGSLEYASSHCIFGEFDGLRHFRYVLLVGLVGQFVSFVRRVLANAQYKKGGRLLVNLVGTRDTILTHFSTHPGENQKAWRTPEGNQGFGETGQLLELRCHEPNIQLEYRLVVGDVDETATKVIMDEVANQLGLAYNHQSEPRCYDYGTSNSPWRQFAILKRNNC
jgi:hypothetical protein